MSGGGSSPGVLPALEAAPDASVLVEDTFDGPALLEADGGRWTALHHTDAMGQSLEVRLDAGVSGGALVLDDQTSGGLQEYGPYLSKDFANVRGDVYFRARLWLSATTPSDLGPHAVGFTSSRAAGAVAASFIFRPNNAVQASHRDNGGYSPAFGQAVLNPPWAYETWRTLDFALLRLGTDAGTALAVVDESIRGQLVRDWVGVEAEGLTLGAPATNRAWVGQLRFDNLAVTVGGPAPARLILVRSMPFAANACAPVRVELRDSFDGGLARAVRPLRLSLSADGGTLFATGCQSPLGAPTVPAAATAFEFAVRGAPGPLTLFARDLDADLASASVSWQLQ